MSKKVKAYYEGMMSDDPKASNNFSFGSPKFKADKMSKSYPSPKKSVKKASKSYSTPVKKDPVKKDPPKKDPPKKDPPKKKGKP